jgi:hypothetical protein
VGDRLGRARAGCAHRISLRGYGTKWHWLATFEKVFSPDLQAQKRFSNLSQNGLEQSPSARSWAIGSGVSQRGFVRPLRIAALGGTKWRKMALFWEVVSVISLGLEAIRNEALWGWSELRPLERKPRICQALCRWIPPFSSQPPAQDRGCRIAPQTVPLTDRMCDRWATGPSVVTHNPAGGI